MADNRQYMALEWVIRDINDTLAQAQRALDAYVRDANDVIQLKFCLTYIHQVYGGLHMAGFHSGAMMASEMEALAQSVLDNNVSHHKEALGVLQKTMTELPIYLETSLETKSDQPSLVFSLLNDLRATRDANFLSECTLFSPDLSFAQTIRGARHPVTNDDQQFVDMLSKLRKMYQVAAASVIHKKNIEENFTYLIKVCQRLEKLLQGSLRLALWEIASAFIGALKDNLLEDTASIKKLLRQLDGEIKILIDGGSRALEECTSEELIKNLLYYLASLTEISPRIEELREQYQLNSLAADASVAVPTPDTMGSYSAAAGSILSHLDSIKQRLDECDEGERFFDGVSWSITKLNQVADTLAMLSVNALRQKALDGVTLLSELTDDSSSSDEKLLLVNRYLQDISVALEKALAEREAAFQPEARQFDAPEELALQESRNGLEEAKDAVVNYIATQWNIKNLQPVPALLNGVSDRLHQLALDVPADILSISASYIEMTMVHQSAQPEWKQLDSLADVIASIDYFLEVLSLTKEEDAAILIGAESGLLNLGVSAQKVQSVMRRLKPAENVVELLVDQATESSEAEPEGNVEPDLDEEAEAEIVEIFVEEAGEVQETIAEYLPAWEENYADNDALIEVRRAFHTLKGSGRIVKAADIGELSWAIENMLNRLLDGTLKPHKIQTDLIHKVLELLPSMVSDFSQRQPTKQAEQCEQYRLWAHDLANHETPDDLLNYFADNISAKKDEPHSGASNIDDEEIDVQLWEIFGSEAESHLAVVREEIVAMDAARPFFETPSDAMQRAMHTLKGSAHMAEITPIASLMTPMELFIKDLRAYQVSIDDDMLQLIKDSVLYTEDALEQVSRLIYPEIQKLDLFLARVAELRERSVGHLIKHEEDDGPKVDPAFLEKLMNEGMNLLLDIDDVIAGWKRTPATPQDWRAVANEVANVQHGAERANLDAMTRLSDVLHAQYEKLIAQSLQADDTLYEVFLDAHYALLDIIDAIAGGQDLPPINQDMIQQLQALSETHGLTVNDRIGVTETSSSTLGSTALLEEDGVSQSASSDLLVPLEVGESESSALQDTSSPDEMVWLEGEEVDDEIIEIFIEEAAELIEDLDATIDDWENGEDAGLSNENLQRLLHTFKGGARLAGLGSLGDLAHNFESYLVGQSKTEPAADVLSTVHRFQDQLIEGVNNIGVKAHEPEAVLDTEQAEPSSDRVEQTDNVVAERPADEQQIEASPDLSDAELSEQGIDAPVASTEESSLSEQRAKHTDSGIDRVSDDIHISANDENKPADDSVGSVDAEPESVKNIDETEQKFSETEITEAKEDNVLSFPAASSDPVVDSPPTPLSQPSTPPPAMSASGVANTATARRPAPQETVKVSADLMEELVNLAGETSISRGRMEEQMSDLGYSLEEMEQTVGRLEEQLRRLDIETEAQVVFRQEQLSEQEDFDPLEMDRYSQLQQLSRSLIESASDLKDLKQTLSNKTRDAETVLLQQSRINTELQEGLMRSRMVPFSRIVPRLRRIVRQISSELSKEVIIEFDQTEGELDRNMMERMVAPLEHMLRNAVDHGIESVAIRNELGKPKEGRISLSLSREGSNVLLLLTDDGAGMSVSRIREKAIQQSLMNADAQLSDQEILQFIFHAGFSTADSVTQISGRGVGMDVVSSEIKQLGGSIDIASLEGQGTQFTIRLPFTVSVNRALMIGMGDDRYAIPLNSIEGIARIQPSDLAGYYKDPDSRFHYAGTDYQLQYMGTLLNSNTLPRLEGHELPVPVLLVRNADHAVAIQVDMLNGSQEIVVKTLGAQFSAVQGLSGATIMGDGHVVVILDANAMIRQHYVVSAAQAALVESKPESETPAINQNPVVMVVDDSVTVRKVTARFLEREGFDVIIAKDGVNAIEILRDHTPDLMLLDIEMPRMDGFEVARRVRATTMTQDLPIIMITSRTGEKHRQTGLAAGANEYMGKPFQEDILLDTIHQLLKSRQTH